MQSVNFTDSKPLLGFGWAGWLASAVWLGVIVCLALGVDLQFQLMHAIYLIGDWPLLYWFVPRPFHSLSMGLVDPVFGFVPLAGLLVAARICHRRISAWLQWLAVAIALVGAAAWFDCLRFLSSVTGTLSDNFSAGYQAFTLLVASAFAWAMTRSHRVTVAFALTLPLPFARQYALNHGWATLNFHVRGVVDWSYWFDQPVFVFLTIVVPIRWAIVDRRRSRLFLNQCVACGYPRDGLDINSSCPECGVVGPTAAA